MSADVLIGDGEGVRLTPHPLRAVAAGRQAQASDGGNPPGSLCSHLAERSLLPFIAGLADGVDDRDRQESRDQCRAKADAGSLLQPFGHAGFPRRQSHRARNHRDQGKRKRHHQTAAEYFFGLAGPRTLSAPSGDRSLSPRRKPAPAFRQYGVPVNTIWTWIRRALLEVRADVQNSTGEADHARKSAIV